MSIDELSIGLDRPPSRLALEGAALFLDLDGTLAPIAERPEDVGPDRRRNDLLSRLETCIQDLYHAPACELAP